MSQNEFLGLTRGQQYVLVGVAGAALLLGGLVIGSGVGSSGPLLIGVGAVMVGYAAVGGVWHGLGETADLTERQRIGAVVGGGLVLIATNTLVSGAVGATVGVAQFFVGLLLVIYGGGLAISAWSE